MKTWLLSLVLVLAACEHKSDTASATDVQATTTDAGVVTSDVVGVADAATADSAVTDATATATDATATDGTATDATATDATATDAADAGNDVTSAADVTATTGGQEGDDCGDADQPACAAPLVCCYPCGQPGCHHKCATPCTGGGACADNGCWLYP